MFTYTVVAHFPGNVTETTKGYLLEMDAEDAIREYFNYSDCVWAEIVSGFYNVRTPYYRD